MGVVVWMKIMSEFMAAMKNDFCEKGQGDEIVCGQQRLKENLIDN